MKRSEMDLYTARLMVEISRHVGRQNIIGMGELYEAVFRERWSHRINDTRRLRTVITILRKLGVPICSDSSPSGGGYYLAAAGSEIEDYLKRLRRKTLRALVLEAKLRKMALPELLGQIELNLTKDFDEAA